MLNCAATVAKVKAMKIKLNFLILMIQLAEKYEKMINLVLAFNQFIKYWNDGNSGVPPRVARHPSRSDAPLSRG